MTKWFLTRECPNCKKEVSVSIDFGNTSFQKVICSTCLHESVLRPMPIFYFWLIVVAFVIGALLFSKRFLNLQGTLGTMVLLLFPLGAYVACSIFGKLKSTQKHPKSPNVE